MLKHFFLCRHAHTQEALPNQSDFDRELSATGIHEAIQTGDFIHSFRLTIDEIICSAARRTQQTAKHIAEVLHFELNKLKPRQELYYPTPLNLLQELAALPNSVETVILISHNPAVSQLISNLTGSKVYVPTGGCNYFISEAPDWASVVYYPFKLKINY